MPEDMWPIWANSARNGINGIYYSKSDFKLFSGSSFLICVIYPSD